MATAVKEKGVPAGVLIGGGILGASLLLFWATRAGAHAAISLTAGWNEVVYTGKRQTAEKALASIMDYLVICYYWNTDSQNWELVTADTIMVTGETYWIGVTQDCTWTF